MFPVFHPEGAFSVSRCTLLYFVLTSRIISFCTTAFPSGCRLSEAVYLYVYFCDECSVCVCVCVCVGQNPAFSGTILQHPSSLIGFKNQY